jgi:voltage-gated sodium channel
MPARKQGSTSAVAKDLAALGPMESDVAGWRGGLKRFFADARVQAVIIALIILNAITLGLETSASIMDQFGSTLLLVDRIILAVFVLEIVLRLAAHGWRFFRDPWSVFDFVVVAIALMPTTGPLSVLRALRVLRVLRLISVIPSLRRVVGGLLAALPGMGAIVALLLILFYVGAVIATKLFGEAFPEMFGTLGASLYTLFQVMTLEGWSGEVVRPVMEVYPHAWAFFIPFILVTAFAMLNLFIGVIVDAMQARDNAGETGDPAPAGPEPAKSAAGNDPALLLAEIRALRREMEGLRARLEGPVGSPGPSPAQAR